MIGIITLQPSVKDESNRFRLFSDSSWNFVCNIISGLQYHYPNLRLVLLLPHKNQLARVDSADLNLRTHATTRIDWERVTIHPIYYCPQIFLSRHHFDSREILGVCKLHKPRFVWITDPCQVLAWKTALHYTNSTSHVPIICCNNWIDVPYQPRVPPHLSFLISQIEGVLCADITLFNSQAAVRLFEDSVRKLLSPEARHTLALKCQTMAPSIDLPTIDELRPASYPTSKFQAISSGRPIKILFNHRINELEFYQSNWQNAFNLLHTLYVEGHSFEVLCTDTAEEKMRRMLLSAYPFIRFAPQLPYKEYISNLWSSEICLGLFSHEGMWSMSLVESMATYCATIVPNHSGYREMVPANYPGLADPNEFDENLNLLRRLFIDTEFRRHLAYIGASYVREKFSNREVIHSISPLIEKYLTY